MPQALRKTLIILAWLLIWQLVSFAVGNTLLLAGPVDVVVRLASCLFTTEFWGGICFSAIRIVAGFCLAFVLGILLAALAWRVTAVREFLQPAVSFVKSVPVVCIIVLLLMWVGASWVSLVAVALMVFPPVYFNCLEGLQRADVQLGQMLTVFRAGAWKRVRYYLWPAVLPYVTSAAKTVVGVSWKAGVAAEIIGIPTGSVGASIYLSKIGLDTAGLFCWTLVIVLLSAACERLFLWILGQSARWSARLPQGVCAGSGDGAAGAVGAGASGALVPGAAIAFEAATFSYGDQAILREFSQVFEGGSRTCVMAPSGTGKTTLLALAAGLLVPQQGSVAAPDGVSMVFQEDRLLLQLSAWDNVGLVCTLRCQRQQQLKSFLDRLLGADSATLSIEACSGGMKRKVALVRALAAGGQALLLDEPFAGMDDASKADAMACIDEFLDGRTLLVATHDSADVALLRAQRFHLQA